MPPVVPIAPLDPEAYIHAGAWTAATRAPYLGANGKIARSSREHRWTGINPPLGSWLADNFRGIHGHEIAMLVQLDPNEVIPTEDMVDLNIECRSDDADRYADWLREGHSPPAVSAWQNDKGRPQIRDGHRRRAACIRAGVPLLAWFWPHTPHPAGLHYGGEDRPLMVGTTYEIIHHQTLDLTRTRTVWATPAVAFTADSRAAHSLSR